MNMMAMKAFMKNIDIGANMYSKRRTDAVSGWVNFPINDPNFKSTQEGGMIVFLAVIPTYLDFETDWARCCGSNQIFLNLSESFIGTDIEPNHDNFYDIDEITPGMKQEFPIEDKYFPHANDEENPEYHSIHLLTCIELGNTGWSGWNNKTEEYWRCTFDDLNDDGKALYRSMRALYGRNAENRLFTFLDT